MNWRRLARLALVWTVLSVVYLLIFEGVVRWFWPQDKTTEHLAGESLGEKDPELGHRLRANAHTRTRTAEFTVEYRTNADGWRDAARYKPERDPSTPRLLVLGDSFTFGEGVDYESIFPVVIEERLGIEVVKAGIPGYDTRLEVLLLERLLARYRPDAVLLIWVPNDLFTNRPIDGPPDEPSAPAADVVTVREEKKQRPMWHSVSLLRRLALGQDAVYARLYAATGRGRFFAATPDATVEAQLAITADLLRRAQELCARDGVALAVASLPQQFQVLVASGQRSFPDLDVHLLDQRLDAVASSSGFAFWPLLDGLSQRYAEDGRDLYYRLDGHLNADGHRAVGELLVERLEPWDALPGL